MHTRIVHVCTCITVHHLHACVYSVYVFVYKVGTISEGFYARHKAILVDKRQGYLIEPAIMSREWPTNVSHY